MPAAMTIDRDGKAILVGDEHEMVVLLLETDHPLAEVDRLIELARLLGERSSPDPWPAPSGKPATSKMYFSG